MEILVFLLPLLVGPFLLAYGLVQLTLARIYDQRSALPMARVHTGYPLEAEKGSWRQRGKRNLTIGLTLSVMLLLVTLSLLEAARG